MTTIDLQHVEQEIIDLHQFFEDYFTGTIPQERLTQFTDAMGDGFTIIASNGRVSDRDTIINAIQSSYNKQDNFRIWIENVTIRHQLDNTLIATYEEWQTVNDVTTTRMSTVVFKVDLNSTKQLSWLIVHESGLKTVEL